MTKMKISELTGPALDWAVAKCELPDGWPAAEIVLGEATDYSTDWSQGGPIIEREGIELICNLNPAEAEKFKTTPHWRASKRAWAKGAIWYGPTPLIAAMRAFVASKLGDEVDVPEGLQ